MGRLHLSSAYDIDVTHARTPTVVEPPKYTEAPFDLDAETDHADVVYEAFLTPQQIREREEDQAVAVPMVIDDHSRVGSPVDSVGTSDGTESMASGIQVDGVATQTESHPMEDWLGRYGFISASMDLSFVPELTRRLDVAIDDAIPAINDALRVESDDCLGRLEAALNPHIDALLAGFPEWSFAENVARLLERSWILETLGLSVQLPGLRPYSARPGAIPDATTLDHLHLGGHVGTSDAIGSVDDDEEVDDAASDPGLDEEDHDDFTLTEIAEHSRLAPPSPPIRPSITPPPTGANLNLSRWWEGTGDSEIRLSRLQDPQRGRVSPFLQTSRSSSVDPVTPIEVDPAAELAEEAIDEDDAHSASGSSTESSSVESAAESSHYSPSTLARLQAIPSITPHQHHRQLLHIPPPHRNYFVLASH